MLALLLCLELVASQFADIGGITVRPRTDCQASVTLTESTGTIFDHEGGEVEDSEGVIHSSYYLANHECVFFINVATADYITLHVASFRTEYLFDFVRVYNGEVIAEEYLLASLSGRDPDELTRDKRRILSSGNTMTVVFTSDDLIEDAGFRADYHASNCPLKCNGNGICKGDTCECDKGFLGADCSLSEDACAGCVQGECDSTPEGHFCHCDEGWHGARCDDPLCVPVQVLTKRSGSLSNAAPHVGVLRPNATCEWIIQPSNLTVGESIALTFDSFDMHDNAEIRVYEGVGFAGRDGSLIGVFTEAPYTVVAHSGKMRVAYSSGLPMNEYSILPASFTAYYAVSSCPSGCSGHGECIFDACHCDMGYMGDACETPFCEDDCHFELTGSACVAGVCGCEPGWRGPDCGTCSVEGPSCSMVCEASTTLTDAEGHVSSGAGDTVPGKTCEWIIEPNHVGNPFSVIVLSFESFDLVSDEAFLEVRDDKHIIGLFSGSRVPATLLGHGRSLTLTLTSTNSPSSTSRGFDLSFKTALCPSDCSGNGSCSEQGECTCFSGWSGDDCAVPACVEDCGATLSHGNCAPLASGGERCECSAGRFGTDCKQTHCHNWPKVIVGNSGVISDHSEGSVYYPHSSCLWKITTETPHPRPAITIVFTDMQTEAGADVVRFYQRIDDDTGAMVQIKSGPFLPMPFIISSDRVDVEFTSDGSIEQAGFSLMWSDSSACPNDCHESGWCIDGICRCYGGKAGESCLEDAPISDVHLIGGPEGTTDASTPLEMGAYQWYFFQHVTNPDYGDYLIEVDVTSSARKYDDSILLFGSERGIPTGEDYDFRSRPDYDPTMSLVMPAEHTSPIVLRFAVYAKRAVTGATLHVRFTEGKIPFVEPPTTQEILESYGFYGIFFLLTGCCVLCIGCAIMWDKRTKAEDLRRQLELDPATTAQMNEMDANFRGTAPSSSQRDHDLESNQL